MDTRPQLLPLLALGGYFCGAVAFSLHVSFQGFCVPPVILSYVTKNNTSDDGCQKFKRLLMQKSEVNIY